MKKLREVRLKIKPSKCRWFQKQLKFLGFKIGEKGIQTDESNVIKIQEAKLPTNITEVRGFIGLCSFYRRFVQNFSHIVEPLVELQ